MVSLPVIDAESQIAVEVLPAALVVSDGKAEVVSDAEGGVEVAICGVQEAAPETLADEALVKAEIDAVMMLEAGADDPKEDFSGAPVGVGRAVSVKLVKTGASVGGVFTPELAIEELYPVTTEVVTFTCGKGTEETLVVLNEVVVSTLDGGVADTAVVPTRVVMLAPGKDMAETPVVAYDVPMFALDAGAPEVPCEDVKDTPLVATEMLILEIDGVTETPVEDVTKIRVVPNEPLILALGEGVFEAPVASAGMLMLAAGNDVLVTVPDGNFRDIPVAERVVMLRPCDAAGIPVVKEALNPDTTESSCAVVSGNGQAHVCPLDECSVGNKLDDAWLPAVALCQTQGGRMACRIHTITR